MKTQCPLKDQLMAVLEDSLPKRERRALEKHMTQCQSCRTASEVLSDIDRILTSVNRPKPPQKLLDQYHGSLAARFGTDRRAAGRIDWISRFILHPSPALRVIQAAAFMLIGLTLGWFIRQEWRSAGVMEFVYSPSIARQIDTYFNESEMWLLDMSNLPQNGDLNMKDWTMTRNDAERLLRKTIAIRELTPVGHDPKFDGYLNGLEILLMELINGQTDDRAEIVEQIKQTIIEFNLLLRTELLQENLRVSQQI